MGAAPTLLIVEPDVLLRHPLAEYLRECGYRVIEALDRMEAQHLLTREGASFDLVLADAGGNLDDGFSLANWIRQKHPDVEVIIAGTLNRAIQKAGELCEEGPAVTKPYGHQYVLDEIRRLLAARDRMRQGRTS